MTMVFAFCVREVRLVWKAVCDDLAGHVRVSRRDPASPSGGDCGCEPGEPVLVPTDLDVVFGQVAVGYPDETGDVARGGSGARDRVVADPFSERQRTRLTASSACRRRPGDALKFTRDGPHEPSTLVITLAYA